MNIGLISTWFERGAAYVTKMYLDALIEAGHNVYVYARGSGQYATDDAIWNKEYVTWGLRLSGTNIYEKHITKWIKENSLDVLFFNEQREFSIVAKLKKRFPEIKIGAYIDYYTDETVELYDIYDFIVCNTMRHMKAFKNHEQKYYIKWGTDVKLYKPKINVRNNNELIFFHSMGMSDRKGTDLLLEAFIRGELYKESKLIIHTQVGISKVSNLGDDELEKYNIEIINRTIGAPGLYHLGDVYVYPTKLEGLGLTMYEALSSGLPVIVTNYPPMNEIINNDVGRLIEVSEVFSRSDGYYWPLAICNINDLIEKMKYYIDNKQHIMEYKERVRNYAINELDFQLRYKEVDEVFEKSKIRNYNNELYQKIINKEKQKKIMLLREITIGNSILHDLLKRTIKKK